MQTIQYMGSKNKVLQYLEDCLKHFVGTHPLPTPATTFFDAFAGSGRVSYHFRDQYTVLSNDKLHFSKTILSAYLCTAFTTPQKEHSTSLIATLNALPEDHFEKTDGWFTEHYGWHENEGRSENELGVKKVWLYKNSKKIDSIRYQIAEWRDTSEIDKSTEDVLLLSLILAINKVSNVVGHQNGYLKKWCANAKRDLVLELPPIEQRPDSEHQQFVGDIFTTMKQVSADIAYFDPPYGTNNKNLSVATRYSSFYHLWNTLVTNTRPILFGKASKPVHTKGYTEPLERNKREVVIPKFIRLIEEVQSPIVAFSYSNKSLLTARDFEEVFRLSGCDMSTFKLYITQHVSNNQTKLANKGGDWIDRANPNAPLTEYFFIAHKPLGRTISTDRTTDPKLTIDIETIPEVNAWLQKPEEYSLPDNTWMYTNTDGNITKLSSMPPTPTLFQQ